MIIIYNITQWGVRDIAVHNPSKHRGIHPMLFQCWGSVKDGGPTLEQH